MGLRSQDTLLLNKLDYLSFILLLLNSTKECNNNLVRQGTQLEAWQSQHLILYTALVYW